ncbi:MAG: efflux RND transporter periplasmic adaptor subunit [Candidatus Brocadiia bacterium]
MTPGTRSLPRLALALGLLAAGCGKGTEVETASPRVGEIRESFSEPARTRLPDTYPVTMPVEGRIGRIDLEPGDPVEAGQELVEFDRLPLEEAVREAQAEVDELEARIRVKKDNSLETTASEEATQAVKATEEALNAAQAEVEAEKTRADRAQRELKRKIPLAEKNVIAEDELDDAKVAAETALIELRKQQFYQAALRAILVAVRLGPRAIDEYVTKKDKEREVLVHQLAQAKARLARARHRRDLATIRSPIDGVVLERYEQGDRTLAAGRKLLLLGDLETLEVVAEVLTQDALRLPPEAEVRLRPAADLEPIAGTVERIEPAGFTKLSSLGVEQQRVNVIVSLSEKREGLGVGFRLQARFFTGTKAQALVVPRFSVLQAPDGSHYVFRVEDGALRRQPVELGLRSDLELEIVEGLSEDDVLVARPDATMADGMEVSVVSE